MKHTEIEEKLDMMVNDPDVSKKDMMDLIKELADRLMTLENEVYGHESFQHGTWWYSNGEWN